MPAQHTLTAHGLDWVYRGPYHGSGILTLENVGWRETTTQIVRIGHMVTIETSLPRHLETPDQKSYQIPATTVIQLESLHAERQLSEVLQEGIIYNAVFEAIGEA